MTPTPEIEKDGFITLGHDHWIPESEEAADE